MSISKRKFSFTLYLLVASMAVLATVLMGLRILNQ